MSSKGRKTGDPLDRYDTPPRPVRRFLAAWAPIAYAHRRRPMLIWEPAAGSGNFLAPLRERFPKAIIRASDIEPRSPEVGNLVDFLESQAEGYELIITNPPFRLAEQFVRHALKLVAPGGYVVMYLRAGFEQAKCRNNFFEEFMPYQTWTCRERPQFTGPASKKGTDSAFYKWFVWRKGYQPEYTEQRWV